MFANGAVTAAMAYTFNQLEERERRRTTGRRMLLGENESAAILTEDLADHRMSLLEEHLSTMEGDLRDMSASEVARFFGRGNPGEADYLFLGARDSLVSYFGQMRVGLQLSSTIEGIDALGSIGLQVGAGKVASKSLKILGASRLARENTPYGPGPVPRAAWSRAPNVSCTDVRVCTFGWR